jgi:hypothetical protein
LSASEVKVFTFSLLMIVILSSFLLVAHVVIQRWSTQWLVTWLTY